MNLFGNVLRIYFDRMKQKEFEVHWKCKWKPLSRVQLFVTPWTIQSMEFSTGVCSLSLLQGIFPTQRSNPGLLHCRQILYQLSHKGSPRILKWVAYSFSTGSSQLRNWTGVSCIACGFFTYWTVRLTSYQERGWWWWLSLLDRKD